MDIKLQKKAWRERITEQKKSLSISEWEQFNAQIHEKLFQSPFWQKVNHIALYYSVDKEVDTTELIKQAWLAGKCVYLPKCNPQDKTLTFYQLDDFDQLETVYYGIPEPIPELCSPATPRVFDLVIVPGLVFDERGYRIGYGAGYYDRFLQSIDRAIPIVSLAFPFQLSDQQLPIDHYDLPVHMIYLPDKTIICSKR